MWYRVEAGARWRACVWSRRSYYYSTTETVADQAVVTRYKCCAGWQHLRGELGCTYRACAAV